MEANINIGNAHTARLKRLLISPSGRAIRNVIPMTISNAYHLKQRAQSNIEVTIAQIKI